MSLCIVSVLMQTNKQNCIDHTHVLTLLNVTFDGSEASHDVMRRYCRMKKRNVTKYLCNWNYQILFFAASSQIGV